MINAHVFTQVFDGNTDSYRVKHAYLDEALFARFIKFHVVNWNGHPSLRVEIMGCQGNQKLNNYFKNRSPEVRSDGFVCQQFAKSTSEIHRTSS